MKRNNTFLITFLALLSSVCFFTITANAQLVGIKTIPGDYATLQLAVADLNSQGVGSGGVTFNLTAGYTESITVPILLTATGTSGNNIIFQKNGVGTNPLITRTDAGTLATTVLGGQGDAVIIIQGSDYVTFDGIDVASSDQGIEYGYYIRKTSDTDGCKFVTIKNAIIDLTKGTSAFVAGIYSSNNDSASLVSSATGITVTSTGGRNENVTITGNQIQDVFAGIILRGFAAATPYDFYDQNFVVGVNGAGNTIQNFAGNTASTSYGVYLIYHNNASINYNTINNVAGGGTGATSTFYGIFHSTGTLSAFTSNNNDINITTSAAAFAIYGINNAATGNLTVDNNIIKINTTIANTGAVGYIYNTSAAASLTVSISNNTFVGTTLSVTGSTYLVYNNSSQLTPGTTNVHGNSISGLINRTGATGTTYCYYNNGSPTGIENIFNNVFDSITTTGTGALYGILSTTGSSHTHNIYNNNVNNFSGGSGTVYGIHRTLAAGNIYNNSVYNLAGGGTVWGISCGSGNVSINKNSIYNLTSTSTGTTVGTVTGIYMSSSTNTYIFNNFISDLKAPACASIDAIRGIGSISTTAASNIGLFYNTIFLNASSTGTNFGSSGIFVTTSATATAAALDMRNNIIVNNSTAVGTGLNVAYRRSSATLTNFAAANNNSFYGGVPSVSNLIFYDGTNSDQTITEYKTRVSPREASSFSENVAFVNTTSTPYDLHVNTTIPSQTESGGIIITTPIAITDDFDGNLRNATTPDVGADEFAGIGLDLSAPSIVYTPLQNTSSTNARTIVATITDASGVPSAAPGWPNLYWKINLAGSWTAVTPSSVAGSDYTYNFGSGVIVSDTVYYYVVAQDNASTPNIGAFPSVGASGFTANPPAAATPPTIPSSYLITQSGLSGSYTVGLSLFNKLSGRNITFEKVIKKVMVEVSIEQNSVGKTNSVESTAANITSGINKKLVEVEEVSWIPVENGIPFEGDLYLKKTVDPFINYPDGVEGVYASITAAVADLNLRGVSGVTTFLLVDSLYNTETLPLIINVTNTDIPTATNTVTLKPNTGVVANITGAIASSQVFRILNNYVTIDGSNSGGISRDLTISNTSTTTPQVILIGSLGTVSRTNVTVKNCNLINGINTSSALIISDGTTAGTAGWFKNITIQNNTIQKAYIGAYCNAVFASGNGSGLLLTQNDLNSSGVNAIAYTGLYLQGVDSATVSLNRIANFDGVTGQDDRGIWFATGTRNSIVERNIINTLKYSGTSGYGAYGIAVSTATTGANVTIKNNMIFDISGDGWNYTSVLGDNPHGIYIFSVQTGINVYYNSIKLSGNTLNQTSALSSGICIGTGTVADVRDNIVINNLGLLGAVGYGSAGILLQAVSTQLSLSNYNDLFVAPTGTGVKNVAQIATTGYTTLSAWQTASSLDLNSVSDSVAFTSANDLHIPNGTITVVESAGTPIVGITTDMDGDTRNVTKPDIGADEFNGINSTNALAGIYYIGVAGSGPGGTDPDFATLKAACDSLNVSNVSGNTTFLITSNLVEPTNTSIGIDPGAYTVTFKPYTGTVDTITFTQVADNVGVSGGLVLGTPTLTITSATNYGLVTTENIIIDGSNTVDGTTRDLVFRTAAGINGNTNPIRIIGDVNNCTIKNIIVQTNQSVSYAVSITNRNFTAVNWTPDNIIVDNCSVTNTFGNAAQGIAISNSGTPTAFPTGMIFRNNYVSARTRGIFLNYAGNTDVYNNNVMVNQTTSGSLSYGIWGFVIGDTSNVTNIYNNQITLLSSANSLTGDYGIIGIEAGSRGTYNIYNNMISGFTTTTVTVNPNIKLVGIRLQGALVKSNVYHNSIYLPDLTLVPGTGTVLYTGFYIANGTNELKNNIVNSYEVDFPSYCIYRSGALGTLVSNYNDFYVADTTNGNIGFWNTAATKTFAEWQTASSLDANSLNVIAPFASTSDLHIPDGTITLLESAGTPIALVTTDIDGQVRNLSTPDIGADEFAGLLQINAPSNLTAVADTFAILLNWTDNSTNELGFYIERKDGDSLSVNPFAVIDTVGVDVVSYNDLGRTPNTTYTYRIQAYNLFGVSTYSNIVTATTIIPVELTSFVANVSEREISVMWSTATELNNRGFELERKLNGEWQKLIFIEGKGTTTEKSDYLYSDKFKYDGFQGTVYYRLKQIDFDGTSTYSKAISVEVDFTPKEYALYQNYPNPFNPSTTIKFALPFDSNVRITIYNLLGEKVDVIFDQVKEVGYHNVSWSAGSLASGVYLYTIEAKSIDGLKNFNSVKKMMLVK